MDKLIVAIIRHEVLEKLSSVLKKENLTFMYSEVKGFCKEVHLYHGDIQKRIRIEILAKEADLDKVKNIILTDACCGLEGDGCLSIYNLEEFINFNDYKKRKGGNYNA